MPSQPPASSISVGARLGCLYAVLLSLSMAFVISVGSVMGDCVPGPGCHDDDGASIRSGLLRAAPIVLMFGAAASLIFAGAYALFHRRLSPRALWIFLTFATLALAWISFEPAFELYFWWWSNN